MKEINDSKIKELKNEVQNMNKKNSILFLIKKKNIKDPLDIAIVLGCTVKSIKDYVWVMQMRQGIDVSI